MPAQIMKKLVHLIFYSAVILSFLNIPGQTLRQKWAIISDAGDKVTYVDTSSIRHADDQISVWVMETFRDSLQIQQGMPYVSRIKTQYLLNKAKRKYSIIGKLYYDKRGRLVGESSRPSFSVGGETFALSIDDNNHVLFILKNVLQYLGEDYSFYSVDNTKEPIILEKNNEKIEDKPDEDSVLTQDNSGIVRVELDEYKSNNRIKEAPKEEFDSSITAAAENDEQSRRLPQTIGDESVRIYDPISGESVRLRTEKESNPVLPSAPVPKEQPRKTETEKPPKRNTYNVSSEKNVTTTIFTDGTKYCFQVSSWKNKSIAERERDKLKAKGHNAFIVEAQPFGENRGTWYRVRVGYFDTLQEARSEQRKG